MIRLDSQACPRRTRRMPLFWRRGRVAVWALSMLMGALVTAAPAAAAAHFIPIAKGDLILSLYDRVVEERPNGKILAQTGIPNATFPTGSAFDSHGNLFVTDFSISDGGEILRVDAITGAVTTFSNDAILGDGTTYDSPESIAFGPDGYMHALTPIASDRVAVSTLSIR